MTVGELIDFLSTISRNAEVIMEVLDDHAPLENVIPSLAENKVYLAHGDRIED